MTRSCNPRTPPIRLGRFRFPSEHPVFVASAEWLRAQIAALCRCQHPTQWRKLSGWQACRSCRAWKLRYPKPLAALNRSWAFRVLQCFAYCKCFETDYGRVGKERQGVELNPLFATWAPSNSRKLWIVVPRNTHARRCFRLMLVQNWLWAAGGRISKKEQAAQLRPVNLVGIIMNYH